MASTPYQWFFRHFLYAPDLRGVTSGGLVESSWTMETNLAIIYLNITKFIINYWTIMIIDIYWTMNYWLYIYMYNYIYISSINISIFIFFFPQFIAGEVPSFFGKLKDLPDRGSGAPRQVLEGPKEFQPEPAERMKVVTVVFRRRGSDCSIFLWKIMGFLMIQWKFIVIQWDINGIYPLVNIQYRKHHNF